MTGWRYHSGVEYPQPPHIRKPGSRSDLIERAILAEIAALKGKTTTVRFLFYRLVSEGVLPKSYPGSREPAQDVSRVATEMRLSGLIPLESIVDRGRGTINFLGWDTVGEGVQGTLDQIRLDPWDGDAPQIWVESDSLAGVIESIASDFRVPLVALRGQASISFAHELSERVIDGTRVLYLGDLDLSGGHIESAVVERVEAFGDVTLDTTRLAVTAEQVDEFGLTVLSKYDKRSKTHNDAVETEALGQVRIETIVSDALTSLLDTAGWTLARLRSEEVVQRAEVRDRLLMV